MSVCASLHDETAKCRQIELYDDDDFSLWFVILTNVIIFVVGIGFLILVLNYIAKYRYKKKLQNAIGKYVTEYSTIGEDNKLKN